MAIPRDQITIFNISEGEVEDGADLAAGNIKTVIYDGKHLPVEDQAFDLLVCNSVIEHVPPDQREALAKEMRRVAKIVFCQTPAWSFPFEPHFLMPFVHWLPRPLGFLLIQISPWRLLARPGAATIKSYFWGTQLLRRAEVVKLFPQADLQLERAMGMVKSYYVIEGSK